MIDLAARRQANLDRLMGKKPSNNSKVARISKNEVAEKPETAWHIISLATKKKMVEGKDGRMVQSKELAYPGLIEDALVGMRATTTKTAKKSTVERYSLETMRYMYQVRNKMNSFYMDDMDDSFTDYFKSVVEILDGYACDVASLAVSEDENLLERVYEIDCAEKGVEA